MFYIWDVDSPFNGYGRYLKDRYDETAYRVAVDAGFSCPNRGEDRSRPGCSYCDELGARAPYQEGAPGRGGIGAKERREAIRDQIERGLRFLRSRYDARLFLLYFQAFSGTHAAPQILRGIYDYALTLAPFRELIVSTRPDCIDSEKADLLAGYRKPDREVWVELGLQSAHDETLQRIDRGHTFADFTAAYAVLRDRGLKLTVHLIFGLPGENRDDIFETVKRVASLEPDGVKIHNLHIPVNTTILKEYRLGEITVPSSRRHLEYVVRALELLPPSTVIMRVNCDTPSDRRVLPRRFWDKQRLYARLREEMTRRRTFQGRLYGSLQAVEPRTRAAEDDRSEDI